MGKAQFDLDIDGTEPKYTPHEKRVAKSQKNATWYYLGSIGEIGFTIALPIAGGGFIGKYLDEVWGSYPKATLGFLLLGIVIAVIGFVQTIATFTREKGTHT